MATFVNDTMTEASNTALESHTPETGGAWSKQSGFTAGATVDATEDRCKGDTSTTAIYQNAGAPAGVDYDVQATVRMTSLATSPHVGLIARAAAAASTFYQTYYNNDTPALLLDKVVAGAGTNLGSYNPSPSIDTDYTLKLQCYDAAKKAFWDGVERISSTDNAITAAGKAGLRVRADGRIDNFVATDLGAGGDPWMPIPLVGYGGGFVGPSRSFVG